MQKLDVVLAFRKHQSTVHHNIMEEDTSQDKLWLMPTCHNEIWTNESYSLLWAKLYVGTCVGVCVCDFVYIYIYIYVYIYTPPQYFERAPKID